MDVTRRAMVASSWHGIWHDVPVTGFLIENDGSAASADSDTVR
jgi:hypothetical protein